MPEAKLLLICAAAPAALAAVLALRRWRRRGGPMLTQSRPLPKMKGSPDASAGRRVDLAPGRELTHLLEAGRQVEAVRLVRERTGRDSREADEAVARLENLKKRLES